MSDFESSPEAAYLAGTIAKRAGLQQGADYGYQIGFNEGYRNGVAAMQQQLDRLQAENAKSRVDAELMADLLIVARAAVAALHSASLPQKIDFLEQYKLITDNLKTRGYVACAPHASNAFRKQYPDTFSFITRMLTSATEPQAPDNSPSL